MKKIYIELTEKQKQKLFPIQDALMQSNARGAPGMVLAQVLFTGREAVAVVGLIKYEQAQALNEVMRKGKSTTMMTDKMTRRRLAKARL